MGKREWWYGRAATLSANARVPSQPDAPIAKHNIMSLHHIKTIAIDLDGTLLDTIPDLCASVNLVLDEMGYEPLPIDLVKPSSARG